MICERCHTREATIKASQVIWPSDEPETHGYCESCYPAVEAEATQRYNASGVAPVELPDLKTIKAAQYLEIAGRAEQNGVDKPLFRKLREELSLRPEVRQRLTFEILHMVLRALKLGQAPGPMVIFECFPPLEVIEATRRAEYAAWLEKVVFKCAVLTQGLPAGSWIGGPFMTLMMFALPTLRDVERGRFDSVVGTLKMKIGGAKDSARWKMIRRYLE